MRKVIIATLVVCLIQASLAHAQPSSVRIRITEASGARTTGLAAAVESGVLEFAPEPDYQVRHIPLDAITTIEQARRGSRQVAIGAGVATGVGVFLLSFLSAFNCQPDEHVEGPCWRTFQALMFVGSPVSGWLVGHRVRRTTWHPITPEALETLLQKPVTPADR